MIERWLYHSSLPFPDVALAYHETIAKEQGHAFDHLTFYIVLPVLNHHMVRKLDVPDGIDIAPIHGSFEDVTEDSELTTHPVQKVFADSIFLLRAGRNATVFRLYIRPLLPEACVGSINRRWVSHKLPGPEILSDSLGLATMTLRLAFYAQLKAIDKLFVLIFRCEWNSRYSQCLGRGRSPESVRRHIAAHHSTSPDHCSFTDSHVGQDDTVGANEDVLFDDDFSIARWSSGSRVKVRDDRGSESDCAVVPDCYVRRMYLINVHKLSYPDVASNRNSAHPMQPRSQAESSRSYKGHPTRKPTEQNWQHQQPLPLFWYPKRWRLDVRAPFFTAAPIAFARYFHRQRSPLKTLACLTCSTSRSAANCRKSLSRMSAISSGVSRRELQESLLFVLLSDRTEQHLESRSSMLQSADRNNPSAWTDTYPFRF